jgi:uncharacterized protein with GYD domain
LEEEMSKYILLMDWTEQGIKSVKDSPQRLDKARQMGGESGVMIEDFYMTMGAHDMVATVEAPDDESMARFGLLLAGAGNVRTTTLKAFPEVDYRRVIGGL